MKTLNTLIMLFLAAVLVSACAAVSTNDTYQLNSGQILHNDLIMTSRQTTLAANSRVTGGVYRAITWLDDNHILYDTADDGGSAEIGVLTSDGQSQKLPIFYIVGILL